jgi:hypothetical protein
MVTSDLNTDELLAGVKEFSFDMLAMQRTMNEKVGTANAPGVLTVVGTHLFSQIGVEAELGVSSERTHTFLRAIEASYNQVSGLLVQ